MSSTLGSLVVNLEANIVRFTQDMSRASQQTEHAMGRINGALDAMKASMAALGVGVGIGGLATMVKASIDAADSLRDMSQMTGVAVVSLNGLGFAAGQAGGSLESIAAASGKLNKAVAEAASGNKETSAAFKVLGIDVQDASGKLKTADVVIAEIADRFQNYADGPEKSAIALRLFGKAGADMIPLLNDGGDALRENMEYAKQYSGMTTELSNAADNFNDTMGKLTVQQKSFSNAISSAVLPVLQAVAEEMLGASEKANGFSLAGEAARTVLETFVIAGSEVAFTFKAVGTEIGGISAQLVALAKRDFKGFSVIGDAMKRDAEIARKEHDAFIARVLDRTPVVAVATATVGNKPAAPRLPGSVTTAAPRVSGGQSEAEKALAEGARMVAKLKEQDEAYGLSGAALLQYQLAAMKIPQTLKDQALAHQVNIDAMKSSELASESFRKEQQEALQAMEDAARRTTEQNAQDVERIALGLMSGMERDEAAHRATLESLQIFHDEKLENVERANALMEAENQRHAQVQADMQLSSAQNLLNIAQSSAGQLYDALQAAGMEQTALGKAMFWAQKAIQVATIIVNTEVAAAAAQAGMIAAAGATAAVSGPAGPAILAAGIAAGAAYASVTRAMGYATAGLVAGTAIASAEGGYDIPGGVNPVTQLHEKEMVLPRAQADVIRGLAANGGSGRGGDFKLTMVSNGTPQRIVESRKIAPDEWAMIVEDAKNATAASFSDPNSKPSRALHSNFGIQRSR